MLVAGYVVSNNTQHRDRYEDQDGFPRHFMIRPLATTNGADIFGLVKRGKAPRFPFQGGPSLRYAPRQSLENYRADRHGIASRAFRRGMRLGACWPRWCVSPARISPQHQIPLKSDEPASFIVAAGAGVSLMILLGSLFGWWVAHLYDNRALR